MVSLATQLPPPRADGRLTMLATPRAYALAVDVDPTQERFSASVRIDVDVPAKTSYLVMHGRGLAIKSARAVIANQPPIEAATSFRTAAGGLVPEEPRPRICEATSARPGANRDRVRRAVRR